MTTPVEKKNHSKFCEFHDKVGHNTDECVHLKKQIKEMLKAVKLSYLIKELKQNNGKEQPKTAKKGETLEKEKPDEEHSASASMNFVVVRSPSPYNRIIRRHEFRKLQAVLLTAHGMLKIPVEEGIITLKSSMLVPLECAMVSKPEGSFPVTKPMVEERIKVAINQEHPKQTIMIGSTLVEEGHNKLCSLLQRNLDVFAWKPADMTGIPRHIAKHRLNVREGCSLVKQKKRGQAADRHQVIQEEVRKLIEVEMHKKSDFHWTAKAEEVVKDKQEKDKIRTKPDKNGKREKAWKYQNSVIIKKAEKDAFGNKQYKPEDIQELFRELFNDVQNIHEELAEYINTPGWNRPAFYNNGDDDDEDYLDSTPKNDRFDTKSYLLESLLNRDESIPPGIDNDDSDSKGDNLFLERLLHDDPISLLDTLDFSYDVRVFLPFFTYPVTSSILLSSRSEDIIFDPGWNRPAFYNNGDDDDEDCTIAITPDFLITDSLIMGDKHLDTIPEKKSDEFIKSSVENLVSNPSEFEDECECDVPYCDDSQTTNFQRFPILSSTILPLVMTSQVMRSEFNPIHNEDLDSTPKNDLFDTKSYLLESLLNRDESIPPGIDNDDSDSEGDNLFLERLLHDDPIPLSDTLDFSYDVRVFIPFFTYPVTSSILLSSGSEDTIFDPGISNYHFSSLERGVSHRSRTFMKFNIYPNHLNESPMEILSSTCSPMDQ
uniref:Reverse transcriptase domain-containing protein n=1 Tax=Tanacetum cinerariifolium TaxID=118510 RepID=A0A6L2M6T8_TANCI|nr:reverse transcriptase domain-containing protein [Tanacetum cinerariifolium]